MALHVKHKVELLISVGSNFSEKEIYLKNAARCIENELGVITAFSKVYQTPSWGFDSNDFYNACFCVQTSFTTRQSLSILLDIEKQLGRVTKTDTSKSYQDRPIDLDIIASSEGVFNSDQLTVPHRLMQQRRFVLIPLFDIAPSWKHPLLHLTTKQLLEYCEDDSKLLEVTNFDWT